MNAARRHPIGSEVNVDKAVRSGPNFAIGGMWLAAAALSLSPDVVALDVIAAQTLARQSGCLACHSVYQKKLGPAWKDVASQYHSQPQAAQKLRTHVMTGRKVKRADGEEDDHPILKTADPKRIDNLVAWILALPVAAPVDAKAAQTLARQSRCLKCHAVAVAKDGPAWKDVAAKYLGSLGAEERLYKHVTTGRKAKFADGHEEDHPIVKTPNPDRISNLVNWILSLK